MLKFFYIEDKNIEYETLSVDTVKPLNFNYNKISMKKPMMIF